MQRVQATQRIDIRLRTVDSHTLAIWKNCHQSIYCIRSDNNNKKKHISI